MENIKTPYIEIGKRPKVILAIACTDTIKARTALAIVQSLHDTNFDYDLIMSIGCDLIGSRTRLVNQAIARGGTHMLFVDHDMYFPCVLNPVTGKKENPISRLLSHQKDVVGVPYCYRSLPSRTTVIPFDAQPSASGKFEIDPNTLSKTLFKAKALGTGFLLIKLSVFEKIEKPWFQFGRNADAEMVYGEDTFFINQVMKAGLEAWCDPVCDVKHIGEYLY